MQKHFDFLQNLCHNVNMGDVNIQLILMMGISVGITTNCLSDTWTVDDDGKADFSSIQDAIVFSSSGDFINVFEGVYYESLNFLGKAITVRGANATTTIVDGSNNTKAVVTFDSGETRQSVLSTLTIRRGQGNFWVDPTFGQQRCGGGIFCEQTSPTIQLCIIVDNAAWGGAGIFVTEGSPFIMFNQITHNEASGHGGGIFLSGHVNAIIDSCNVTNNVATWGGGMTCMDESDATILNCSFNENTTNNVGGGMFIRSSSSPIVLGCEFKDNLQTLNPLGSGGGVCIYGGGTTGGPCYPTFRLCVFERNTVNGDGGGMSAAYASHPKIEDCYFRYNTAGRSGGGLACVADEDHQYPSNADVLDVTLEFNQAAEEGGGIHVRNSDPIFVFVYVQFNSADNQGGGMNFFESPNAYMQTSFICGNTNGQISGTFSDGGGNSISDSCGNCDGDVNSDGVVNVSDILMVVGTWGPCGDPCPSDVNNDGVVNVSDILLVVGNWGPC